MKAATWWLELVSKATLAESWYFNKATLSGNCIAYITSYQGVEDTGNGCPVLLQKAIHWDVLAIHDTDEIFALLSSFPGTCPVNLGAA